MNILHRLRAKTRLHYGNFVNSQGKFSKCVITLGISFGAADQSGFSAYNRDMRFSNCSAAFVSNSADDSATKCLCNQSCSGNNDQNEKSRQSHKCLLEIHPFAARPDMGLNDRHNIRHAVGSIVRRCEQKFMKREVLELYPNAETRDGQRIVLSVLDRISNQRSRPQFSPMLN